MSAFFGSALLVADTVTMLYEHAGANPITVNIRAANQNKSSVQYWVAIGSGAQPEGKNCITPNVFVPGNTPWEDTAQRINPGEKIWAKATKGDVSVRVFGAED